MTTRGSLLLVEDDPFAAEIIRSVVAELYGAGMPLIHLTSESEFLARWNSIRQSKPLPAAVILDARLPWEGSVEAPGSPPGEAAAAGSRILAHIRGDHAFAALPVLVYSVNEPDRLGMPEPLPARTTYMRKDAPDELLVEWLESIA